MSLVAGFLTDKYVCFCGDTCLTLPNGNTSTIQKVHYFNQNILWAFTGDVQSNVIPIKEFLANGYFDFTKTSNVSFNTLNDKLKKHYNALYASLLKSNQNASVKKYPQFNTMIAGIENGAFTIYRYSLIEKVQSCEKYVEDSSCVQHIIMGKQEHEKNLCMPIFYPTISDLSQTFQNVLDKGVIFDKSINNMQQYVFLQKGNCNVNK